MHFCNSVTLQLKPPFVVDVGLNVVVSFAVVVVVAGVVDVVVVGVVSLPAAVSQLELTTCLVWSPVARPHISRFLL